MPDRFLLRNSIRAFLKRYTSIYSWSFFHSFCYSNYLTWSLKNGIVTASLSDNFSWKKTRGFLLSENNCRKITLPARFISIMTLWRVAYLVRISAMETFIDTRGSNNERYRDYNLIGLFPAKNWPIAQKKYGFKIAVLDSWFPSLGDPIIKYFDQLPDWQLICANGPF